jgi:hypothetical protein
VITCYKKYKIKHVTTLYNAQQTGTAEVSVKNYANHSLVQGKNAFLWYVLLNLETFNKEFEMVVNLEELEHV